MPILACLGMVWVACPGVICKDNECLINYRAELVREQEYYIFNKIVKINYLESGMDTVWSEMTENPQTALPEKILTASSNINFGFQKLVAPYFYFYVSLYFMSSGDRAEDIAYFKSMFGKLEIDFDYYLPK